MPAKSPVVHFRYVVPAYGSTPASDTIACNRKLNPNSVEHTTNPQFVTCRRCNNVLSR